MALDKISANVNDQKNCLEIVVNSTGNLMVKILNVNGQFIKTVTQSVHNNAGKFSVGLDDLSRGIYIVNVFKDNSFIKSLQYNKY